MPEGTITVLDNGPLLVTGNIDVVDAEGNRIQTKDQFGLCRCGESKNKPFCDGVHQENFNNCVRAKNLTS